MPGSAISKRNLVLFSLERWDDVWRRNQHFCSRLLQRYPDAQIAWVNPAIDPWFGGLPELARTRIGEPLRAEFSDRLFTVDIVKPLPNRLGSTLNDQTYTWCIAHAIKKLGWETYDIWINNHTLQETAKALKRGQIIYDITDDWTLVDMANHLSKLVREKDDWLTRHADKVVVCSQRLFGSRTQTRHDIYLVPNGCPSEAFNRLETAPVPTEQTIVGYVGTLQEERLDLKLLTECAAALPQVSFVLYGPNCLQPNSIQTLKRFSNIEIRGSIKYDKVPQTINSFTVCMTPHVVTPFTESLDPIKLYEYMAAGKAVVSTNCAGFRDLPEFVKIGSTRQDFVEAIKSALQNPISSDQSDRMRAWAQQHSWDRRVDEIQAILGWS